MVFGRFNELGAVTYDQLHCLRLFLPRSYVMGGNRFERLAIVIG